MKTKKLLSKIWGYIVWILVVLLAISIVRNLGSVSRIKSDVQAEKDRLAKLQAENQSLEDQIARTQTQDFIEAQVRNDLGLVKPGETEVVLPDDETLAKLAPPTAVQGNTLPDPNWKRWEKLFF